MIEKRSEMAGSSLDNVVVRRKGHGLFVYLFMVVYLTDLERESFENKKLLICNAIGFH